MTQNFNVVNRFYRAHLYSCVIITIFAKSLDISLAHTTSGTAKTQMEILVNISHCIACHDCSNKITKKATCKYNKRLEQSKSIHVLRNATVHYSTHIYSIATSKSYS